MRVRTGGTRPLDGLAWNPDEKARPEVALHLEFKLPLFIAPCLRGLDARRVECGINRPNHRSEKRGEHEANNHAELHDRLQVALELRGALKSNQRAVAQQQTNHETEHGDHDGFGHNQRSHLRLGKSPHVQYGDFANTAETAEPNRIGDPESSEEKRTKPDRPRREMENLELSIA